MNCPSAGKLKCLQGSALMLIHSHQEASQCWYQDINYANHYLAFFFSKACVFFTYFFLHLLHQVSHDQVMCVFWQCHLSAPEQCSNTTHFLCYISRARWAWSFGCLKRILFLSSIPTFYERSDSLHNHFSTPKIDKNYAKSTSVHENTWKTEVQEGTIVLKYPQRACQRHCS